MSGPGMVPAESIYGGDGWSRTLTIKNKATGAVIDLTAVWSGWKAQWRPTAGARSVLDITIDATSAATGVLKLSLTGVQTGAMGGEGVWDLQYIPIGGTDPVTILRQSTTWVQDVTRNA